MTYRVKDLPYEMQPRSQVRYKGIEKVGPEVLLAVLLRTGVRGRNVLETAQDLLQSFGSLEALSKATWQAIKAKKIAGVGEVAAMVIASAFELERRAADHQHKIVLRELHGISDVVDVLYDGCRKMDQETFFVLPLTEDNKILTEPIVLAQGKRHGVDFDIGKVFEVAVRFSSDKIVVAHNHPSGDARPSSMDLILTRRLIDASKILGVQVVDHIIIGNDRNRCFSIRDSGLVTF